MEGGAAMSGGSEQNVLALSLLLATALLTNLAAAPVILFRRTRFGNGQFACLILCLTLCDLVTVVTGLVGGLVLELGDLSWAGSSQGCAAYYFISSWLVGLSNYLVSCLVCLLLVKRAAGVLARLQECRLLLLCLTLFSLLPALPELAIHSTISDPELNFSFCIVTAPPHAYNLYVTCKLALRHLLPAAAILLATLRPRTTVAKRISLVFLGQPAVCECGPEGKTLSTPHECSTMARGTAVAPDLLRDTESCAAASLVQHHTRQVKPRQAVTSSSGLPALVEDPVRRTYKRLLAISFLTTATTYFLVDLSYQVIHLLF